MITRYPWFGPKKYLGWGWTPITWQGVAVTIASIGAALGALAYFGQTVIGVAASLLCVAIFLVIVVLTGTKPGGPGW